MARCHIAPLVPAPWTSTSGSPLPSSRMASMAAQRTVTWLGRRRLDQPRRVARGVTERGVDAVGPLCRLLGELDSAALELLVGGLAVVGAEEDPAGSALGDDLLELGGGVGVEHRRARDLDERQRDVGLTGRPDGEPAEAAELGHRDVVTDLESDLVGVERKRLVLVV